MLATRAGYMNTRHKHESDDSICPPSLQYLSAPNFFVILPSRAMGSPAPKITDSTLMEMVWLFSADEENPPRKDFRVLWSGSSVG